jgi:hypothetical protein
MLRTPPWHRHRPGSPQTGPRCLETPLVFYVYLFIYIYICTSVCIYIYVQLCTYIHLSVCVKSALSSIKLQFCGSNCISSIKIYRVPCCVYLQHITCSYVFLPKTLNRASPTSHEKPLSHSITYTNWLRTVSSLADVLRFYQSTSSQRSFSQFNIYPLVIEHSYWRWPFSSLIYPLKRVIFHTYVYKRLPEGTRIERLKPPNVMRKKTME